MPDLIITNIGTLVSGDWEHPVLDCDTVAIRGGLIDAVGGAELLSRYPDAQVLDAMGVTVAPGLIDSHCHPCVGDYTFRQKAADFLESEVHGGVTTMISAGEPHFPGRPKDAAGAKAQAIFLSKCFREPVAAGREDSRRRADSGAGTRGSGLRRDGARGGVARRGDRGSARSNPRPTRPPSSRSPRGTASGSRCTRAAPRSPAARR